MVQDAAAYQALLDRVASLTSIALLRVVHIRRGARLRPSADELKRRPEIHKRQIAVALTPHRCSRNTNENHVAVESALNRRH